MKNLQIIKEKMNNNNLVKNVVLIQDVRDIRDFLEIEGDVINDTRIINSIINKYVNPQVMKFKFNGLEQAKAWLANQINDFEKIELNNLTTNKKFMIAIQY